MVAHVTGDAGVDVVLDGIEAAQKQTPGPQTRKQRPAPYRDSRILRQPGIRVAGGAPRRSRRHAAGMALQGRRRAGGGTRRRPPRALHRAENTAAGRGGRRDQHRPHARARLERRPESVQPAAHDILRDHAPDRIRTGAGSGEAVTRQEALRMMTSAAARFSFDEKQRGSIEVGKLGDFVVLDDHFLTVPAERLRTMRPDVTVIGGRIAFDREKEKRP